MQIPKDCVEICLEQAKMGATEVCVYKQQEIWRILVPSAFHFLDEVRDHVNEFYALRSDVDVIAMAVHELVANAIEHGNCANSTKFVHLHLSEDSVSVEDEGRGFDWQSRTMNGVSLDLDSERGRGLAMVQLMSGTLVFNESGNRIILLLS